jgi:integrase/recombinase XerD
MEVTLADVDSWTRALDRKGHAAASMARRLSAVRSFSAHLVRSGLRRDDFTELAHGPRLRRKLPGMISAEEAAKVVSAPDTGTPQGLRDRAMLEMMYGSGLRISELCSLELQAVEADVPQAQACLESLARDLGCGNPERRSYLELLLES